METRARIALVISDALAFAKAFVQTISENNIPVLLPNSNPGTLEKFKGEYDSVISNCSPAPLKDIRRLNPDSPVIFFTSGSTGEPKKIEKALHHLLSEVEVLENFFGPLGRGSVYSTVSHQHIYGLLFSILWPLYSGRAIGDQPITFPEQLETLEASRENYILISSPSFLGRLDRTARHTYCSLVTSSGALLPSEVSKQACEVFGHNPYEIFGSTESGGVAWRRQSVKNENGPWTLIDKVKMRLNFESKLEIESPFFFGPSLLMEDRATRVGDSQFVLQGRADRIVKVEGKRISLIEIEETLVQSGLVAEARAICETTHRDQIAAVVVLNETGRKALTNESDREVKIRLRQHLATYFEAVALPKRFRFVDAIPRNSESKVNVDSVRGLLDAE